MDPIPIKETEEEKAAAAAEQAKLMPVLRRLAVAKVSLFTEKEKDKLLMPLKRKLQEVEKLNDIATISAMIRPTQLADGGDDSCSQYHV